MTIVQMALVLFVFHLALRNPEQSVRARERSRRSC
jgi:hypothetical protein